MTPLSCPVPTLSPQAYLGDVQGLPVKHLDVPVAEEVADRAKQLEQPEASSQDEEEDQQGTAVYPARGCTGRVT